MLEASRRLIRILVTVVATHCIMQLKKTNLASDDVCVEAAVGVTGGIHITPKTGGTVNSATSG